MQTSLKLIFTAALLLLSQISMAEVININNQQLKDLMAEGVPLMDIRRQDEWDDLGIIKGSHRLTFFNRFGRYDAQKWLNDAYKIAPPDQAVILLCHLGVRTKAVSDWLGKQTRYKTVYNVTKGIDGWLKEGNPTKK